MAWVRKLFWVGIVTIALVVSASAIGIVFIDQIVNYPLVRKLIVKRISVATGMVVQARQFAVTAQDGIGVSGHQVNMEGIDGHRRIAVAQVQIHWRWRDLLRARWTPDNIFLDQPDVQWTGFRTAEKQTRAAPAGETSISPASVAADLPRIVVRNGRLALNAPAVIMDRLSLTALPDPALPDALQIALAGRLEYQRQYMTIKATGTLAMAAPLTCKGKINIAALPLTLLPKVASLPIDHGTVDIDLDVDGQLDGKVVATAALQGKDVRFRLINAKRSHLYDFPKPWLRLYAAYDAQRLSISNFELDIPQTRISGNFSWDHAQNQHLRLEVQAPNMKMAAFKQVLPAAILPEWIETWLMPALTGGQVRLNRFRLDGAPAQWAALDAPQNADTLFLDIELDKVVMFKKQSPLPLSDVAAQVVIDHAALTVSRLQATCGQSSLTAGRLLMPKLYQMPDRYTLAATGRFALQDIRQQAQALLPTTWTAPYLDNVKTLDGMLTGTIKAASEKEDRLRLQSGTNLKLSQAHIVAKSLIFPIAIDHATLAVSKDGHNQAQASGKWGNSALTVRMQTPPAWDQFKIEADGHAAIDQLLAHFQPDRPPIVTSPHPLPCALTVSGAGRAWNVQGDLGIGGATVMAGRIPIEPAEKSRLTVDLQIDGNQVRTDQLGVGAGASQLSLGAPLNWPLPAGAWRIELVADQFDLHGWKVDANAASGLANGRIAISGPLKSLALGGQLDITAARFQLNANAPVISQGHLTLQADAGGSTIIDLASYVGRSPVSAKAQLSRLWPPRGRIQIHCSRFDLADMMPGGLPDLKQHADIQPVAWDDSTHTAEHSDLLMRVEELLWNQSRFGPLHVVGRYHRGQLLVDQLALDWPHGRVAAKARIAFDNGRPVPAAMVYSAIRNQPIDKILKFLEFDNYVTANGFDLESLIRIQGPDPDAWLRSLSGVLETAAMDGVIHKSNVLFPILKFMSIENIIKGEWKFDGSDKGLPFSRLDGHWDIHAGVATSNSLVMKSPVLNAVGQSVIDLPAFHIKGQIQAQPLGSVDAVLGKIPILRHLLLNRSGSFLGLTFDVDGPLDKPAVKYHPAADIGEQMMGRMESLLKTPSRLYDRLTDAHPDASKSTMQQQFEAQSAEDL